MDKKVIKNLFECGICFESLDSKQIDISTQLDCSHIYHDKCLKKWCIECINNDNQPNCPLCRKNITGEYFEILGVNSNYNLEIKTIINTVNLFEYIIKNKLYMDLDNLHKVMEKYPDEFDRINLMLKGYLLLNSLRTNFEQI